MSAPVPAAHSSLHDRMDRPSRRDHPVHLALRHGRPKEPPLPPGYDGERQLAELHALTTAAPNVRLP